MTTPIVPCIWLSDQAEQAAAFYVRTFPGGRISATARYPEAFDNPGGRPRGSVLTVDFEVAGQRFTALNGGPVFQLNPSISFLVQVETREEADRLFGKLGEGGKELMALDSYPWSERYGWVADRFGVNWQVMAWRRPPGRAVIVPCLMFSGPQHGRAEEAMRDYTQAFAQGRIDSVERYQEGEGPKGMVKHARFFLAGQEMAAMDSHLAHDITFNEALSLQVMCEGQAEIDRYWDVLAQGGQHGPCGWLKDRFGLSWQVAPSDVAQWMADPDTAARDRTFKAVMGMTKLDLAALQRAHAGEEPASLGAAEAPPGP